MSDTHPFHPKADSESYIAPLKLDTEKYRHHIEDLEPSPTQEREFLSVIWNILNMCIDLNIDVDSVQLISQEKARNALECSGDDSVNGVAMKKISDQFNRPAKQLNDKEDQDAP